MPAPATPRSRRTPPSRSPAPPATPGRARRPTPAPCQGTWASAHGGDGYLTPGAATNPPAYATVTTSGASPCTWVAGATDPRDTPVSPGSSNRVAACWYSGTSFSVDVNLTDGQAH